MNRSRTAAVVALAMILSGQATAATADTGHTAGPATSARGDHKPLPADPLSGMPSEVRAQMLAQQPYSQAAKQIQMSIVASGQEAGFAGIALGDRSVQLWWKGRVPAQVQRAVTAARRQVPVEVRSARHSRLELKAEAARLAAAMQADPASSLHTVQIPVDGSRLITVFDSAAGLVTGDTVRTSTRPTARSVRIAGNGIPVQVAVRKRAAPAGRWDDGAGGTFSGGAAIINQDNGARCTSGFGVKNGAGTRFLLTAGHCGRPGGGWWNGNRSLTIGTASNENVGHDLLLIPTSADHWIWDGGATSNMFVKQVINWDWARANELVCQSGSTSGAVCGIRNTSNFTAVTCGDDAYGHYECYNDLIDSFTDSGGTACRSGDSGAPVFTLASGYNQVIAKGTVTGCGGSEMTYQDFGTAWRDFGIVPIG